MPRAAIVAAARGWLGTPYLHQTSAKGVATDCLGLVRGLYRELVGPEPEKIPPYTPDWAETKAEETFLAGARRHLVPCPVEAMAPGDVLLFRVARRGPAKHAAILSEPGRIIHAYAGHAVTESHLNRWWRARLVAVFSFPGAEEWPNSS